METKAKMSKSKLFSQLSLPMVLVLLSLIFFIISPEFLSPANLVNLLVQNAHVCIVAAAMAMIMICGGADLSIGYQMSMVLISVAIMISWYFVPVWLAVLLGIGLAVLMGTINGILSLKLKTPTMIVALGTMAIYQGLSYILSGSRSIYNLDPRFLFLGQGRILGIPVNVIIMVVLLAATSFLLNRTYLGRFFYAVGDNPEAAKLTGIHVGFVRIIVFSIAGLLVGVSAILLCSRTGSAISAMGPGMEFTSITACVLGGVSLRGGEGKLWRVITAVFILGVLANGMQIIGLGVYPQYVAKGVIMLIAIGLDLKNKE